MKLRDATPYVLFFRTTSGSPVTEPGGFTGNFHTICGTSHTETSTNIMELPGARLSREILGHFRLQYGVVRCIVGSRGVSRSPGSPSGLPVGAPRMCVFAKPLVVLPLVVVVVVVRLLVARIGLGKRRAEKRRYLGGVLKPRRRRLPLELRNTRG